MEFQKKMICPECGKSVRAGAFCPECGSPLILPKGKGETVAAQHVITDEDVLSWMQDSKDPGVIPTLPKTKENTKVSDKGLAILVDLTHQTLATVGGDGYQEYVLYQREPDSYELHYYEKFEDMEQEIHYAWKSTAEIAEEAAQHLKEKKLEQYVHASYGGMSGADHILRYRTGEQMIRLSTENLPEELQGVFHEIETILKKTAVESMVI